MARHINELIASRRALLGGLAGLPLLDLAACATPAVTPSAGASSGGTFASVAATNADTVSLPPGYAWRKLIAWGDALFEGIPDQPNLDAMTRAEQERRFGQNNDMLALFAGAYAFPPPKDQDRMILCANNEYATLELLYPALRSPRDITAAQIEATYAAVGVSVVDLARDGANWRVVKSSAAGGNNRRITPFTPVVFSGPAATHPWIEAAAAVVNAAEPAPAGSTAPSNAVRCGTGANCAGGLTPWGTYLTAEENFDGLFVGSLNTRIQFEDPALALDASSFGYPGFGFTDRTPRQFNVAENPRGPSLYGWIVEIDPYDPTSTPKKRTALGRKKNECATTAITRDGRVAVYMGDDQRNEYVYKFVSRNRFDPANRAANMDLLDDGQLYCAQFDENGDGRWIAITLEAANAAAEAEESPIRFRDEADLLMRARDAARFLGATPMDRPEDIEALHDENWRGVGPVLIACTNNSERGFARPGNPRREDPERPYAAQSNLAGHILRLDEAGGDSAATRFTWDIFAMGGDPNSETGTVRTRGGGSAAFVSNVFDGQATTSGERFACPDNLFIDSTHRAWIATDGSDFVFEDCNDCVMMTPVAAEHPRPIKRFLVGPVGAEICGPLMAPDERTFFCAIQHPGANNVAGTDFSTLRWQGEAPTSHFPDGGRSWPRSAVVVITKDDGGRIGD
ncbi:MAG: PhoX family phosphatase [Hyphomonadaceae bacterium]